MSDKGAEFVECRGNRLGLQSLRIASELLRPELPDDRVTHARDDFIPETFLGEKAIEKQKIGPGVTGHSKNSIPEDVLKPWPPKLRPVLAKDADQVGSEQRRIRMRSPSLAKDIERDGILSVLWCKKHDLACAFAGNMRESSVHEVAMRIEKRESCARCEILNGQVRKKRRLTRARLAEDPEMPESVLWKKPEPAMLSSKGRLSQDEEFSPLPRRCWRVPLHAF